MATPSREHSQRPDAYDPHPTPISSYIGVAIMAALALMMVMLQLTSGASL
jgi:hypothetical protein